MRGDGTFLFYMLLLSLRLLIWGVYHFPGFLSNTYFLHRNSYFLCRYPVLPRFLHALPRVVHGGGGGRGVPVWIGGVCSLVRGVTWACSLICQTNSQLRIAALLPLPQGTGEPSSAEHP